MAGRVPLLDGLDDAALVRLGVNEARFACPSGAHIFRQGEPTNGVYVLEEGAVDLIGRTPGDGEVLLARLGAGETVGEFSLLDAGVRSATARAAQPVTGWHIALDRFLPLVHSGDDAAHLLLDRLRLEVAERTRATLVDIAALVANGAGVVRAPATASPPAATAAQDMAQLLVTFPGFSRLDASDWSALSAMAQRIDAPRGTALADAGCHADALFVVARGAVRATLPAPGGVEQLLLHGPGSFAGIAPVLDGGERALSLDMREDGVLFVLDAGDVATLRRGGTSMARQVMAAAGLQMVRDLRRLSRHLGRMRGGQV